MTFIVLCYNLREKVRFGYSLSLRCCLLLAFSNGVTRSPHNVRIRECPVHSGVKPHCGSFQTTLCSLPTASLSLKLRKGVHMIVSFAYKVSLRVLMVIYRAVDPRKTQGRGVRRQRKKKTLRMCGAGRRHFWLNPGLELIFCHPLAPSAAWVQLKESKRRRGGAVRGAEGSRSGSERASNRVGTVCQREF